MPNNYPVVFVASTRVVFPQKSNEAKHAFEEHSFKTFFCNVKTIFLRIEEERALCFLIHYLSRFIAEFLDFLKT